MKKILPYVLIGILILTAVVLFISGNKVGSKKFNKSVTLKHRDKIPYGTYVAYNSLQYLFPKASVSVDRNEPGYWDSLQMASEKQAIIIVTDKFTPDESEMQKLLTFIENGNDVFISSMRVNYMAEKYIKCDIFYPASDNYFRTPQDSLKVSILNPSDLVPAKFSYPGYREAYWFHSVDTSTTVVLGHNEDGQANFVHLKAGKGNLYLHLAPLAFSNYFLLHKQNMGYMDKAMSYISPDTRMVVWDEYYLQKEEEQPENPDRNYLSVLMNMQNDAGQFSFRSALVLALITLLLYTLMEMRRRQRPIPVMRKPGNDSLDFVKTIGRLYHDRSDHHNLSRKMAAYFLDYVRSRYKLSTATLDENFTRDLAYKSGVPESEIAAIVNFISSLGSTRKVTDAGLVNFHRQLEAFYKKA